MAIAAAPRVIEVRKLQGPSRCETVLAAFDALAPGQSLVVVTDHVPASLLRHLQAGRRGQFEWSPLEAGPECFRTEITRRAAESGSRREISEALAWDHDRLEALEQRAFDLFAESDSNGARATWKDFSFGLHRHIRFEEEILFPTFEERTGVSPMAGPTAVLRAEHREIEALLEAIGRSFEGQGSPLPLRADLHRVLGGHNLKEEQVLYPGTDQQLGLEERDALVARIQAS